MKVFSVEWDPKTGVFTPDIHVPESEGEMHMLATACARLLVAVSVSSAESTPFVCHSGCTFAAIVDMAHKEFRGQDPKEYDRVVESGQLTKSVVTGSKH